MAEYFVKDNHRALLDPSTVLRLTPRSFAFRVHDRSMLGADIKEGDIIVGEFTPTARPGAIVVALVDGESVLKRLVNCDDGLRLVSENPDRVDPLPLSELVIQGLGHTLVRRIKLNS